MVGLVTSGSIFAGLVALAPAAHAADATAAPVTVTAAQQDADVASSPFPGLSVTVSQTTDLVNQGIRLTYSGGKKSAPPTSQNAGQNFLQVMECWGDLKDPTTGKAILDKDNQPQPDRTTCQYGSANINQGQTRHNVLESVAAADPADVAAGYVYPGTGFFDPAQVWIPFASATGKTLAGVVDGKFVKDPTTGALPNLDSNEFYGPYTTNEVPWAGFGADGTGTATYEVQTAMQAPGLGCGNPVTTGTTVTGQPCWLVVVPRGDHDLTAVGNTGSGLLAQTWKHRLAVRLSFKPLGVRCALGAAERQVAGSELVSLALQSWQPVLCNQTGGSIYNVVRSSESDAASKANGTGSAPLALVSRPFDAATYGAADSLTYAPIAITGLTVAFAVDHNSNPLTPPPAAIQALDALPFTQMRLTPRLVAKLLTNSYRASMPTTASVPYLGKSPGNITQDPDFLKVNPDWAGQSIYSVALADVFVPLGTSDSARAVWTYVMADQEARDFLAGKADPWGMKVNPWATTSADYDATVNPPGVAADYPTDRFPKPDPSDGRLIASDPKTTVDAIAWRPYSLSFDQGAYWVLRGDQRSAAWNAGAAAGGSGAASFTTNPRDYPGQQKVMGLTDTAAASKYQVYTAALENPAGQFVTPTVDSMSAAAAVMTPDATQSQVVAFDPTSAQAKGAAAAYPLTVPVYAATNPAGGDAASRAAVAALIRYAAGDGQTVGTGLGQLPPGYAPLPAALRTQALAAAGTIAAGPVPEPTTPPTVTPAPAADQSGGTVDLTSNPASALPGSTVPTAPAPTAPAPAAGAAAATKPTPTPTPTGPPAPVLGAATPTDTGTGALGAAVPISAGGGLLAALLVPFVSRPRRAT